MGISLRKNKVSSSAASDGPTVTVEAVANKKKETRVAPIKKEEFCQQFPSVADLKRAAAANICARKEIIHLQIGQCGNQLGSKFWEELCLDHGVGYDNTFGGHSEAQLHCISSYFNELSAGRFVPRAIAIDLETGTLKSFRASRVGRSFNPENILCGEETSYGNWATAYYRTGPTVQDKFLNVIRKAAERCDWLQGFQLVHSLAGGTGSGFTALLMECLRDEYPDRIQMTFSVFPSSAASTPSNYTLEIYNSLMGIGHLVQQADMTFCLDNEALWDISTNLLKQKGSFTDINRIVAANMLSSTTPFRFANQAIGDPRKLNSVMNPIPKAHFLTSSFAPLVGQNAKSYTQVSEEEVVLQLGQNSNHAFSCQIDTGQNLAASAVVRGQVSVKSVDEEMAKLRQRSYGNFMNCSKEKVMTSYCSLEQSGYRISGVMIRNNTAVHKSFASISDHFTRMFRRKAFLHHYIGEGMDEMEFTVNESNLNDLVDLYRSLEARDTWTGPNSTWKEANNPDDTISQE